MEGHQIAPKYIWIIIAHYMDIVGVVALESCSKWFQGTVFDESFWKHRLIRDFQNDPSFHYFVDVPARMQYRDLLLFRPDPNEKSPFVQRVVLMGPGADSLLEKLKSMNVASKKQAHHDYYVGEAKTVLKVGLLKKTFEIAVHVSAHVSKSANFDACIVCLGTETSPAVVEGEIKKMEVFLAQPLVAPMMSVQSLENKSMVQLICGLAPKEKIDFDFAKVNYKMQSSLLDQYARAVEKLKSFSELPETCLAPKEIGVPYVLADNEVGFLRALLGEMTFRMQYNKAIGTMLGRAARLKQAHPENTDKGKEQEEEKKCIIS